jgi:hypothetical protein
VRDNARVVFLTNEAELGDFGVDGLQMKRGGYVMASSTFAESLFVVGVEWTLGAHVSRVDAQQVTYETLDGETHTLAFDFAMLLPPFTGVGLRAVDGMGEDITAKLFAPNAFMPVDAPWVPFSPTLQHREPGTSPRTFRIVRPREIRRSSIGTIRGRRKARRRDLENAGASISLIGEVLSVGHKSIAPTAAGVPRKGAIASMHAAQRPGEEGMPDPWGMGALDRDGE